jgi:L-lactate dehydrogenase (cytochrome)
MLVTKEELSRHCTKESLWISVNGNVWDVTDFINGHPGREGPLLHYGGKDATEGFMKVHPKIEINKILHYSSFKGTLY